MEQLRFKSYDVARILLVKRGFIKTNDADLVEHWQNGPVHMILERHFANSAVLMTAGFRFCEPARTQDWLLEFNCSEEE